MDKLLRESGMDFEKVDYYIEPLSEKKLRELVRKMGIRPHDLLRTNERIYRDHDWSLRELTDDDIFSLMAKHPDLIQRPIVERGERAVLARPIENVKALLGK